MRAGGLSDHGLGPWPASVLWSLAQAIGESASEATVAQGRGAAKDAAAAAREADAAPAKAPLGTACAAKAEPRITTKKPVAPANSATTVPTSHASVMKLENITPPWGARCAIARG